MTTAPTKAPEPKFPCESDQGCEPATEVPMEILVEFDTGEDWLIDWNSEILLPTLPHPNLVSYLSLIITGTVLLDCINQKN